MKTTSDSLPSSGDAILLEFERIKTILNCVNDQNQSNKKHTLDFQETLEFFEKKGLRMSKSKLYKLCSSKKIPHKHFGSQPIFDETELEKWITKNLK